MVLQSISIKVFHHAVLGRALTGLRRQMLGITSLWVIKSVELAVAAKRLGIDVECTQEHWNDKNEEGRSAGEGAAATCNPKGAALQPVHRAF